jgi:hypothetical protein
MFLGRLGRAGTVAVYRADFQRSRVVRGAKRRSNRGFA